MSISCTKKWFIILLNKRILNKDKVSIISLKDHNYFSKTQNSRFKNIKDPNKKLNRAGSMPNFDYKDGSHESTKESYLKPNIINESLNGKLFRRATIAPSPMRTVENLKINIESFPEKVIPMKGSEIQEESVSIQENSNTAQNQNNELLTMRYDSVMNKTHKKVGKVQFQSIHENPSEKLVLPPVHSAEELTESLKIPKLVKNILEKKMKLNPDLEKCEDDDIKIGKHCSNIK